MDTLHYIKWFFWAAAMFALLQAVQIPVRKTNSHLLKLFVWVIKLVLMIALAFALIAFAAPIFWRHGYPFAALYIALLADVLCDPLKAVLYGFRKKTDQKISLLLSLLSMAAVLIYGTVNMERVVPSRHVYTSGKLKQSYTAVFVSDLHIGSSQSEAVVEKAFNEIRELHPDFILLGGDISDEQSRNDEMKWTYEQLGKMDVPVYYIYGNHDRQPRSAYMYGPTYSRDELADTITDNGLIILQDELVKIGDDLYLLGREDTSEITRKDVNELEKAPEDAYVLVVDHSPYEDGDIIAYGADLQISGHTHAGQFFPLRMIYDMLNYHAYGDYQIGSTKLLVSAGISGWGYPFRNEAHSSYDVIELRPAE